MPEGPGVRMTIVRRWRVRGIVQGVGFRWFVMREARRLRVRGYADNLPDGGVEVVAQGDANSLQVLLQGLQRGPRGARVDRVEEVDVPSGLTIPEDFETR
jgi:acylphosphatase